VVQENYKVFNLAASLLHPLAVWDAICCGGASFSQLNSGLPTHFQAELHGIVDALHSSYSTVALVVLEAAKLLLEVRQTEESVARGHAEFSAAVTESQLAAAESGACTATGAGEEATAEESVARGHAEFSAAATESQLAAAESGACTAAGAGEEATAEESVARGHAEFSAAVTESQLTAAESGACTATGAGEEATAEESIARGHAEFSAAATESQLAAAESGACTAAGAGEEATTAAAAATAAAATESQLTAAESGACTAAGAGEEATAAAAAAAAVAAEAKENVVIAAAMEAAALPLTSSFVKALQYVCAKQIVTAPPMFLLSSTSATAQDDSWQLACKVASRIAQAPLGAGQLRHLLMDCVRPGVDGCLPGYTPSPNFSQVTPPVFVCL